MTFGYWFWLGVGCVIGALALLVQTRSGNPGRKPRTTRTIHAIALFALLAFGGFKCAREEQLRAELLAHESPIYTIARTRSDGGGMTYHKDKTRVEAVEYSYSLNAQAHSALGKLNDAYTIERDFFAPDFNNRCLLVRVPASRPDISSIVAVLNSCPDSRLIPPQGWAAHNLPQNLTHNSDILSVDTLWWRGI